MGEKEIPEQWLKMTAIREHTMKSKRSNAKRSISIWLWRSLRICLMLYIFHFIADDVMRAFFAVCIVSLLFYYSQIFCLFEIVRFENVIRWESKGRMFFWMLNETAWLSNLDFHIHTLLWFSSTDFLFGVGCFFFSLYLFSSCIRSLFYYLCISIFECEKFENAK